MVGDGFVRGFVKEERKTMKRLGSYLKGYTLGTLFVLLHVATYELRMHHTGTLTQ